MNSVRPGVLLVLAGALCTGLLHADTGARYALDPTHSVLHFEIDWTPLSTQRGRFDKASGHVQYDRAGRSGRVDVSLDTRTLNTGVPAFDALLRGPAGLDVQAHPAAQFRSQRWIFDGEHPSAIEGTLTLRGREHPVRLLTQRFNCYLNPLFRREVCGGDFTATLDARAHGLGAAVTGASAEIRLLVQVEAIREEP